MTMRRRFSRGDNQFTAGGGYDRSRAGFIQSTNWAISILIAASPVLAPLLMAKRVADVDGEPFDARVDLDG